MPEIQLDIDQLMSDVIELNIAKLADIDTTIQSACNTVATLTVAGWGRRVQSCKMRKQD